MRNAAPMTFGARLASRRLAPGEATWFFNGLVEAESDVAPQATEAPKPAEKVQIGPLDV